MSKWQNILGLNFIDENELSIYASRCLKKLPSFAQLKAKILKHRKVYCKYTKPANPVRNFCRQTLVAPPYC